MNHPDAAGVRARPGLIFVGVALMLIGGCLAHWIQTAGGIRILDVRFAGTGGTPMSALLYIPPNATRKTPAPGVLAVHGYFNSRETQGDFAIEFARRGYVVLAIDQTGHGFSAPPAFANGFGGPDGLRYLRSLDVVDKDNIGLEGHSMGGWAVVNAAAAVPDGYKAIVLAGSGTGAPFAREGTKEFPRNLAVVFSKFDEFAPVMWGIPAAREISNSKKLWKAFDTQGPVEPGKLYGSIENGTGRMLYTPGGSHPWDHMSKTAIGAAVDWFQRTLTGGTPKPVDDQTWYWKELGTTLAFAGFVVLLLGVFDLLLRLPYFAPLLSAPAIAATSRNVRWWVTLLIGALLPAITLFPFFQLGSRVLPASKLFPQAFTNEIVVWAVLNALLVVALSFLPGSTKPQFKVSVRRSIWIALLTMAAAYISVVLMDAFFQTDLRYWFMALKPMGAMHVRIFLAYLMPFTLFFVLVLRAMHASLSVHGDSPAAHYWSSIAALVGGFGVFLLVQYGYLFSTGHTTNFFMNDALHTIVTVNFLPLMTIAGLVATFAFRRTASYLPGALICALLVSWYVVVGQATQVAG